MRSGGAKEPLAAASLPRADTMCPSNVRQDRSNQRNRRGGCNPEPSCRQRRSRRYL